MRKVQPIRDLAKLGASRRHLAGGPGGTRDVAFLILGVNSGMKASELLGLAVGQIHGGKGAIRQAAELPGRKAGKAKAFPISDAAREALLPHLALLAAKGAAGPRRPPLPCQWERRHLGPEDGPQDHVGWRPGCGLAGIGTDSLRKTFEYHLFKRIGGNLALVQKMLNHAKSGDTLRYIGLDREEEDMGGACLKLNLASRAALGGDERGHAGAAEPDPGPGRLEALRFGAETAAGRR